MQVIIIVAMTPDGLIGRNGGLPWHIPADLKHFKKTTEGHAVLMGRKTYDSVGKPLPRRRNIVITREPARIIPIPPDAQGTSLEALKSLEVGLKTCSQRGEQKAFIAGGAEIFALGLPLAEEMIVTWVHQQVAAGAPSATDTFFPLWKPADWQASRLPNDEGLDIVSYRLNART